MPQPPRTSQSLISGNERVGRTGRKGEMVTTNHKLKEYRTKGEKITITVSPQGTFAAYHDEDFEQAIAYGTTLEQVQKQVDRIIRNFLRIRVEVPFTTHDFKQATAIGRHARTNRILVRTADGQSRELDYYYQRYTYQPNLSRAALTSRKKIEELKEKVEKMLQAWEEKYRFDLPTTLDAAINEQRALRSDAQDVPND